MRIVGGRLERGLAEEVAGEAVAVAIFLGAARQGVVELPPLALSHPLAPQITSPAQVMILMRPVAAPSGTVTRSN